MSAVTATAEPAVPGEGATHVVDYTSVNKRPNTPPAGPAKKHKRQHNSAFGGCKVMRLGANQPGLSLGHTHMCTYPTQKRHRRGHRDLRQVTQGWVRCRTKVLVQHGGSQRVAKHADGSVAGDRALKRRNMKGRQAVGIMHTYEVESQAGRNAAK